MPKKMATLEVSVRNLGGISAQTHDVDRWSLDHGVLSVTTTMGMKISFSPAIQWVLTENRRV